MLVALSHAPESMCAPPLPQTARSAGTLTPSLLSEHLVSLYVFPQLALSQSSALMAFGASGESAAGTGARMSLGRQSLHYLLRGYSHAHLLEIESRPVFQAGWGVRLGEFRVGLSYAWAAAGLEQARTRRWLYPGGGQQGIRKESTFLAANYRQGTLGFGWQRGRKSLDLAVALMRLDIESNCSYLDERAHDLELRRKATNGILISTSGYHPVLALRLEVPLGEHSLLRGYGFFRDEGFDTSLERYAKEWTNNIVVEDQADEYRDADYGHEWSCGVSIEGRAPKSIRWIIHGLYENERSPFLHSLHSRACTGRWRWLRDQEKRDKGQCGLALRIPFYWRLEILSGATVGAETATVISQEYLDDEFVPPSSLRAESTSYGFGWGLARSFGALHLTVSLRKTLDPGDPFALLDAEIRI